jgi:hypothetical protein
MLEILSLGKHFQSIVVIHLVDLFVSYEQNEVLRIWPFVVTP